MTNENRSPAPEYRDHFEWWCNNLENEVRHDPDWDEHIAEQAFAAGFRAAATPAPAPADHATVEQWEAALTAVMPSDFKDWHQNSRREWPNIAAHVIGNLRQREDEAWATVERLTATAPAPATGKPGLQVEQAPAVPTLPAHQRTAPARIYLHDGDDEHTELFPGGMDDGVTWSSDNATGLGVPYVRADLIRSSVAEADHFPDAGKMVPQPVAGAPIDSHQTACTSHCNERSQPVDGDVLSHTARAYRMAKALADHLSVVPAETQPVAQPLSVHLKNEIYRQAFGLVDSRLVGDQLTFVSAIERACADAWGVTLAGSAGGEG